jgi:hypothetical protein
MLCLAKIEDALLVEHIVDMHRLAFEDQPKVRIFALTACQGTEIV